MVRFAGVAACGLDECRIAERRMGDDPPSFVADAYDVAGAESTVCGGVIAAARVHGAFL